MECRLDRPLPEVSPRLPVRIGPLTTDDLPAFLRFRPEADAAETRGRLERGTRCFAVWHEDQIVHAGWAVTRQARVEFLDWELPLEPGDVFQFDSHTAPAFRGLDLAGARVAWMARFYREAGARRLLAVVWVKNTAAFRPLEKAGYRRGGWIRAIRLGPFRYVLHRRSPSRQ
jgi:GNAT superfamily N-acetyltransferase